MINVQLNLIIPVFIPANNAYRILSVVDYDVQYPSVEIEPNQDLDEIISMLLKRYLKESSGVITKLTDIGINNNYMHIYYMCYVNYETTAINGVLKNIDVNNQNYPTNAARTLALLQKK